MNLQYRFDGDEPDRCINQGSSVKEKHEWEVEQAWWFEPWSVQLVQMEVTGWAHLVWKVASLIVTQGSVSGHNAGDVTFVIIEKWEWMNAYYGHHKTNSNVKGDSGDLWREEVAMHEFWLRTKGVYLTNIRRE